MSFDVPVEFILNATCPKTFDFTAATLGSGGSSIDGGRGGRFT
jgi:hypothetical protein